MAVERENALTTVVPTTVLRTFVGILVPPARTMLESLRSDVDLQTLPVRWLMPNGLHITLAFLGETPGSQLQEVWPMLAIGLAKFRPLQLQLTKPEPYPDPQRPRLIAAPVLQDRVALATLQAAVTAILARGGYDIDPRPFHPHVSLGRLRLPLLRGQAAAINAALAAGTWGGGEPFTVSSVGLLRSDVFPDGARYSLLADAALEGRA